MGRSYKEELSRESQKIVSSKAKIANYESEKKAIDLKIATLIRDIASAEDRVISIEARAMRRRQERVVRIMTPIGEFAKVRYLRVRQALSVICEEQSLPKPDWIFAINDGDVRYVNRHTLSENYIMSDSGIAPLLDIGTRKVLVDRFLDLFSEATDDSDKSKNEGNIYAIASGWTPASALEISNQFRSEMGVSAERAIQVGERAMIASTAWSLTQEEGEWLNDSALRLMERVRPICDACDGKSDGKSAGATIDVYIKKAMEGSSSQIDNLRFLHDALAVFSTPGAMARAYRSGLDENERKFARSWFHGNRDFAAELGHRVGSTKAFSQVVADADAFRVRHFGAAPKNGPEQTARFWAQEEDNAAFRTESPDELIEEARNALVDTTLNASLVSMPKTRERFLNLGAWEGNERLHEGVIDVTDHANKAFLVEARDAAEIEIMQGTNPLAVAVGLVTWVSADDKKREAPLFLALADFNEETKTVIRKAPFVLNQSLFRRIEADYPAADRKASIFDALRDVAFGTNLVDIFDRVIEAVAGRTSGKSPILEIKDVCLVGSFDSSRAVLARRLDLKVFPTLVGNPVVKMLAEGSTQKLVLGEYDPKGARSPPDEIQRLAVKVILGGTSFVLEGPPGTGKTATIVAMLDALSKAGKRVLVSAAMPGAIEVIGRRSTGRFAFGLSSMRDGEINVGVEAKKVDFKNVSGTVFIGAPMALIKDIPADATFDVLIVDEASQMRLSHALALAGHVKQIVIAGDSRQLQPQEERGGATSEMSLLKRARQAGFPVVMLETHYRSRHPSLIAWSNMFSYGSKLKPRRGPWFLGDAGFDVNYVDTGRRLSRDGDNVNVEEAEAIATEVVRWAKEGGRSVGVVALTQAQRDLIREVVDKRLVEAGISMRERHTAEKALEASEGSKRPIGFFSSKELFFIRTAGAVQGEERDVILISLGVAPDLEGKIRQNVGLMARKDSVALVNVMLSRSRLRTAVYSSIFPWEINQSAMTPGMFLVASILRMGTIVGAPDMASQNIPPGFLSDEWKVDQFEVAGGDFYAIRHPEFLDRYPLAIAFENKQATTPTIQALAQMGWKMILREKDTVIRFQDMMRRAIRDEITKLLKSRGHSSP